MARKHFQVSTINPYHITGRCLTQDWFALPLEEVWITMSHQLFLMGYGFEIKIHAFVLMANHFHLLASSPNANLSQAMQYFMREVSRWLTKETGRINQAWVGRFHRCEIGSYHDFLNAYKYVYFNPVRTGAADRVENYPYSSLAGLLGLRHLGFPVQEDPLLFPAVDQTLRWLNQLPSRENLETVRKAIRRKTFELPKKDSRLHALEFDVL